jgi:hypothetical protein
MLQNWVINWRFCNGSISSAMTTWSDVATRWTFKASARSRARSIRVLANKLCPPGRCRSATNKGCSENFVPHARTVATKAGCSGGVLVGSVDCKWRRFRNCSGLRRGRRVCTIWKKTSTRSWANLWWHVSDDVLKREATNSQPSLDRWTRDNRAERSDLSCKMDVLCSEILIVQLRGYFAPRIIRWLGITIGEHSDVGPGSRS